MVSYLVVILNRDEATDEGLECVHKSPGCADVQFYIWPWLSFLLVMQWMADWLMP